MYKIKINELKELFNNIPREELGFFPTPIYKVERISKELGINLYLKRDDITGPSVFGGNKIRKLEFLLGDAMKKGATHVITHGATQSNHAMQTAIACNKCGLKPILYLVAVVPPDEDYRANLLLDKVLGAEIHIINLEEGMTEEDGDKIGNKLAEEKIKELANEGKYCYDIPIGGSTAIGTLGFTKGFLELIYQLDDMNIENIDYIVVTTGSGGTLAGILSGKALLEYDTKVVGIAASPKTSEYLKEVAKLSNDALKILGSDKIVTEKDFIVDTNYVGEGYEIPTKASTDAIKRFAREEGIILDPVYTAKTMSGLIDYVDKGIIPKGSNVVFWHTGGGTALFAEKEIVGDIFD